MGLVNRMWVPMVMVVVVAVGALTVSRLHGIFGSDMYRPDSGNADAIVQFNPKRVLYEIFGPAGTVADINYLDADAQPQRVDSDTIGCRITVNGDVREEHSVDGHNAQTSCLVKSA
jgi:hypothetical protein